LIGGIEGQGDETLVGQFAGVEAGGLLFDAAGGVADDDRGPRPIDGIVGGVEVTGEGDAGTVKGDVDSGHEMPRFGYGAEPRCHRLRSRRCAGYATTFASDQSAQQSQIPAWEQTCLPYGARISGEWTP
jgi:hypothetical protein